MRSVTGRFAWRAPERSAEGRTLNMIAAVQHADSWEGLLARFAGMSVLVIDDSADNVALLRAVLNGAGMHRVTTETDPRRVVGLLAAVNPDLVLLDLRMPHLNGHQVLEQVQAFAAGCYLPVLVLTCDSSRQARDRALSRGARDFLSWPFDVSEVLLRVANLLETRQLYANLTLAAGPTPAPRMSSEERCEVQARIRAVLQAGAITPVYQPVLDLQTLATVGYEALTRFPHAHPFGPAGWFADAFAVGLGTELEWSAAARALPFLDSAAAGAFLALNMSPATILAIPDQQLCYPARCPQVVIELTEHVPIEDYSALHRALAPMRAHGARLAADDLGSGYAGFRHLILLEPDIIKLDISLVRGIQHSRGQRALTRALLAFAADMNATVIAEGVDNAEELVVLKDLGVPWAQGYHLGRPASVPDTP